MYVLLLKNVKTGAIFEKEFPSPYLRQEWINKKLKYSKKIAYAGIRNPY